MKLTPSNRTVAGGKVLDSSRKLWDLYRDMEYLYYQGVDIVRENPDAPDLAKLAELYGYENTDEGKAQAWALFELLATAQEQFRAEQINGKQNVLIAIMWKVSA